MRLTNVKGVFSIILNLRSGMAHCKKTLRMNPMQFYRAHG
jgi:hypothetical protein